MANDSKASGYLTPSGTVLDDQGLEDFLHHWVMGVSGLPAAMIRPRWQPEPANQPAFSADWAAFGVTRQTSDTFAYAAHSPTGEGSDSVMVTEELELLLSFYGPNSQSQASKFKHGVQLDQNLDALTAQGMGLVGANDSRTLPALLKERWVRRVDITVTIRRNVTRTYGILNLTAAQALVDNEQYVTTVQTTQP